MITTPLGNVDHTERGFEIIEFPDLNGAVCTLQQSSIAISGKKAGAGAIWLGIELDRLDLTCVPTRMHLEPKQVKALIAVLEMWVDTGNFCE